MGVIHSKVAPYADRFTLFSSHRMDVANGQRRSYALLSMAATKDAISMVAKLQKVSETA
ncbi:hypothetical protein Bra471DRAFT_05845 [Bradyrhizobium sp. WSM471]|nr:hypothetical protein Bra471DRAFT_05845 [Bradyrhizobium sp. WSM471]